MEPADLPNVADEFTEITLPEKRLYLQALARTGRVDAAARAAGVSLKTGYNWRADADDAAFQAALVAAIKMSVEGWEGELARRGFQGLEKPVYQGGRLVGTLREYDTPAGIFMLKGALPDKYRDNVDHRHMGPDGGPIQHAHALADLPDDEIERRYRDAMQVVRTHRSLPPVIDVAAEPQATPEASAYAEALAKRNGNNGNSGNGSGG